MVTQGTFVKYKHWGKEKVILTKDSSANLLRLFMCALDYQAVFSLPLIEYMRLTGLDIDHNWKSQASVS